MSKLGDVLIAPVVSEKSNLAGLYNTYVFKVLLTASKIEVRQAIEKFFGVKVQRVNTVNAIGKKRTLGKFNGRTSDYKKAYVQLVPGHKIENLGA
jgi:large subunit ribosomal protein L23